MELSLYYDSILCILFYIILIMNVYYIFLLVFRMDEKKDVAVTAELLPQYLIVYLYGSCTTVVLQLLTVFITDICSMLLC